jgi:hypothetical protein
MVGFGKDFDFRIEPVKSNRSKIDNVNKIYSTKRHDLASKYPLLEEPLNQLNNLNKRISVSSRRAKRLKERSKNKVDINQRTEVNKLVFRQFNSSYLVMIFFLVFFTVILIYIFIHSWDNFDDWSRLS